MAQERQRDMDVLDGDDANAAVTAELPPCPSGQQPGRLGRDRETEEEP
jgi:hypothetical protein